MRDLRKPGEAARAEGFSLGGHRRELILRGVDQPVAGGLGSDSQQHQVAEALQEVGGEAARIVPRFDQLVDSAEHRGAVLGGQRRDHVVDQCDVADPEQRRPPGA